MSSGETNKRNNEQPTQLGIINIKRDYHYQWKGKVYQIMLSDQNMMENTIILIPI